VTVSAPNTPADAAAPEATEERLLRIQEVSDEVGLTPRSIRYYEELGLMKPAARSEGAYRLYDADDVERLRFIKGLRDETGFSLAEIGEMLEDETARAVIGVRFRESRDPDERHQLLVEGIGRIDRQVTTLRRKVERIGEMIAAAEARRDHLAEHLAALDQGVEPEHHATPAGSKP
jgi:MerR family transcriptional regulator, repressor of the yfmOP operon